MAEPIHFCLCVKHLGLAACLNPLILCQSYHFPQVLLLVEFAVGEQLDHIASPHELLPYQSAVLYKVVFPHDLTWIYSRVRLVTRCMEMPQHC